MPDMVELKKKAKRGQIGGNLIGTVMVVISIVLALIIGAVMLGQLATINTNSLGANANATNQIYYGFDLLNTTQGIIVLVVVISLLALALASFMGVFGGMGGSSQGRRK